MPYATAYGYVRRFGADAAAQLLPDPQRLLTGRLLQEAIAVAAGNDWAGPSTPEERQVATEALARLEEQIEIASSTMDSYLRTAVTLPLPADGAAAGTLHDCCLALVRNGLAVDADQATETIVETAATWTSWLRDVATRKVQLVGTSGEPAPASGGVRSGQAASRYDWGRFGAIR